MTNKKKRAIICIIPSVIFFLFVFVQQMKFAKMHDVNEYIAFAIVFPFSFFLYIVFWLGLTYFINQTLNFFGYEE